MLWIIVLSKLRQRLWQSERKSIECGCWKYNDSQLMQQWKWKCSFIISVFMHHTYCTGPSHPQSRTWWSPLWHPPGWRYPSLHRRGLLPLRCSPSAPQPGGTCLQSPQNKKRSWSKNVLQMWVDAKILLVHWVERQRHKIKITRVNSLQLDLCRQDEKSALIHQVGLRDHKHTGET